MGAGSMFKKSEEQGKGEEEGGGGGEMTTSKPFIYYTVTQPVTQPLTLDTALQSYTKYIFVFTRLSGEREQQ